MLPRPILAILSASILCLSACYEDETELQTSVLSAFETEEVAINTTIERDRNGRPVSHALLSKKIPNFATKLSSGGDISQENLEGHWTLINFWGLYCHDSLNDAKYANALKNALDQDPNVDYLSFHTAPKTGKRSKPFGKWESIAAFFQDKGYSQYPIALDLNAEIRKAFEIEWTPSYLLISPNLTVEAFRTDLSVDAENGIKDIVQHIHEVRKKYSNNAELLLPKQGNRSSAPAATISSVGVAGLAGQTPFDLWAIKQAFEGYDVFAGEMETDIGKIDTFEVHNSESLVMYIEADETGDWVGSATATTREFKGPLGETIGVSLLGDIPPNILGDCISSQSSTQTILECRANSISRLSRIFKLPDGFNGSADAISDEIRNAAQLVELRFFPSNRGI